MNEPDRVLVVAAIKALQGKSSHRRVTAEDVGLLGRLFGAGYANTNITGIAIIAMVLLLFFALIHTKAPRIA